MSGAAINTGPAALSKRHHYARAGFERLHVLTDFLDHAREFVAQDGWQPRLHPDPAPVALPQVPVRAADAAALDAHDRAVRRAFRFGPIILDHHRLADLFQHQCFHGSHTSPQFLDLCRVTVMLITTLARESQEATTDSATYSPAMRCGLTKPGRAA